MAERPIIVLDSTLLAIAAGAASLTHQIIMPKPAKTPDVSECKFGGPGDQLWVRESFAWSVKDPDSFGEGPTRDTHNVVIRRLAHRGEWDNYTPVKDGFEVTRVQPHWQSAIHLPRWASRLLLGITGVKAQRIRTITNEQLVASGFTGDARGRTMYWSEWDKRNARRGYSVLSDPWTWAISFEVLS